MASLKKRKYKTWLPAFTLIESLVAIIIVMICFAISSLIYINVLRTDPNYLKLKAYLLVKQYRIETFNERSFIDDKKMVGTIQIEKTVKKYPGKENLKIVEFKAGDKEHAFLYQTRQVIIAEDDDEH